jgi:hypothetical protein
VGDQNPNQCVFGRAAFGTTRSVERALPPPLLRVVSVVIPTPTVKRNSFNCCDPPPQSSSRPLPIPIRLLPTRSHVILLKATEIFQAPQSLDARGLRQSRFALPSQFKEHAQSVIDTFFVVTCFPFLQSTLPRLALSTKRLCNILMQPASRLRSPLYPHRRNIHPTSLEKPVTLQHAPVSAFKQCCLPWHDITSVSGSLQISTRATREPLLRTNGSWHRFTFDLSDCCYIEGIAPSKSTLIVSL